MIPGDGRTLRIDLGVPLDELRKRDPELGVDDRAGIAGNDGIVLLAALRRRDRTRTSRCSG